MHKKWYKVKLKDQLQSAEIINNKTNTTTTNSMAKWVFVKDENTNSWNNRCIPTCVFKIGHERFLLKDFQNKNGRWTDAWNWSWIGIPEITSWRNPQKIKKNVLGQKIDAIRPKINHSNFICRECFFLDGYTYYCRNEYDI